MLSSLRIKNLALVEDLTWEVGPGLVCVTGETGAGKSMIVGALKLILGERADRTHIRTGKENCTIEAVFRISGRAGVNALLEENGLDPCEADELIVRRSITAAGQNRQFVNNGPATLATLKELGGQLIDLHGPHDHQSLLSQDRQLAMLDAYGKTGEALDHFRAKYAEWQATEREREELRGAEQASDAEIELLRHQIAEIEGAAVHPAEEEDVQRRFRLAANSARLAELCGGALQKLADDEQSALEQLRHFQRLLRDLERLDPEWAEAMKTSESAAVELEELERGLRHYAERLDLDPGALAALEERTAVIESLKRKYGGSLEAALDHAARARTRLERFGIRGEALAELETRAAGARAEAVTAAAVLSGARRKAAPRLAREIASHLADLGFQRSFFEIQCMPLAVPGPRGIDEIEFVFAPNPGEPARPLRLIASSGEMSRLMLAAKSALAREDAIPLLVFDEIDANVGGEIGTAVGRKMAALGETHQIIAITHMPQVAALAGAHYEVTKDFSNDRTRSSLRVVAGEERVAEIARMLGGRAESALAHARNLLEAGQSGRDSKRSPGKRAAARLAAAESSESKNP